MMHPVIAEIPWAHRGRALGRIAFRTDNRSDYNCFDLLRRVFAVIPSDYAIWTRNASCAPDRCNRTEAAANRLETESDPHARSRRAAPLRTPNDVVRLVESDELSLLGVPE